nr:hypothetical protein [Tanacetum cinerariifolium]
LRTQLFKKVSDQTDNTQDTSTNTKFAKQPIVENLPKVGKTNALSNPITSNSVSIPQESKGVNNDKVIAPGMFRINPSKSSREEKHVPNTVSASARTKPITVSQPHVITKKDVNSDLNGLYSTGVDNTKTRRPQPRSNTKNDREVISNVVCAMCSKCLISVNHDKCFCNYENDKISGGKKPKAKVYVKEIQMKYQPKVTKSKKVEHHKSLATPKPRKPRFLLRWSPTGRLFNQEGKIVDSSESKRKSTMVIQICLWCVNSGCSKHMTGNLKLLINFIWNFMGMIRFGNDHVAAILGFGDIQWGNILIIRVYFVEGLGHNLFSVGQFCDSDLEVAFRRNACFVRNLEGVDLLKGDRSTNLYTINLHKIAFASPICLMARASSTKSWLWHQRLSHLNFDTINDLARNDLVAGLPKFKYHKEHLCSSCEQGKRKRASHPPKPVPNSRQRLHLLHMDLCGPIRIASINGKRFVLMIVDDYSRYTWVHFLRSKDEAPETLVEAARTMLIFSRAPLFLWAEAIATACFTQNRFIIYRRFNKMPYELINGRKPNISFLHVFSALCYPKNDREDIGKLGAKGDIGFFIGYSADSCLPKFKYHKEHLCPSCKQGKSKRASHPLKPVPNSRQRLHLLHMDLCGPMRIASINGKRITVLLQSPVIIIRTDNVERHNQTLVEAARTMLIFSRASLLLWAEVIATACFTQNRSIIHQRFNKTPYKLINGRKPDISFLHVFGALCYPKNDREDIGKLGAKGDIGFFIGYSADSCAYRVYNHRTKKIMETMNVSFDELSAMAFEQSSLKPGLNRMTSGHISSGLDLTYAPSTITT